MENPRKANPPVNWKEAFLSEYRKTGNLSHSARKARVTRAWVYELRDSDQSFNDAIVEAKHIANAVLEQEALRRATAGTIRPVFYKGIKIAAIREFSDTLLIVLLKANMPDKYRENARIEHTGAGGGPVAVQHSADLSNLDTDELARLYREALAPPSQVQSG